jgi:O-antigen/teichoic acid export membrane protein
MAAEQAPSRRKAASWTLLTAYLITALALVKGFVFIPLYLRYFDLATYGAYGASAEMVGLLAILDVGIATAFHQRLAQRHGEGAAAEFAKMAGAGGIIMGLTAIAILGAGLSLASFVPRLIHAPESAQEAIATTFRLTVVGSVATILNQALLGIPQAWQKPFVNTISRIGGQIADMLLILFGLDQGWGVVALGVGALAGGLLSLALSLALVTRMWWLRALPPPVPDRASLRWLAGVGVPTLLARVAGQIASNLEVTLTSVMLGPAAAGIYNITARTFRLALGFLNPIVGASFSGLAHLRGERGPGALLGPLRELRGIYTLAIGVLLPGIVFINRDFVTLWVGADKYGDDLLTDALALATFLSAELSFLFLTVSATGRLRATAYLSALEGTIRVPLMLLGLSLLGMPGLAFGAALGLGTLVLFAYPPVLARGLELARGPAARIAHAGAPVALLGLGLAVLGAQIVPRAPSWLLLIVKGAGAGLALAAMVLLLDPAAHRLAGAFWRKLAGAR